ncbi:MAG: type II toxin-antitoxin system HicA family toxin [Oscillospiraceae bacterium]|nr:type II toxin-antitoxin system HicA family toxin [Oscillospiraceae bacterium]
MKRRDLIKKLEDAGFQKLRDEGDHTIYFKKGFALASIPRHRELNELTARNILKAAGLK